MKIINKTKLSYSLIGAIIDKIIESNADDTLYHGKVDFTIIKLNNYEHKIKVQIRYLKRYTEWYFTEI